MPGQQAAATSPIPGQRRSWCVAWVFTLARLHGRPFAVSSVLAVALGVHRAEPSAPRQLVCLLQQGSPWCGCVHLNYGCLANRTLRQRTVIHVQSVMSYGCGSDKLLSTCSRELHAGGGVRHAGDTRVWSRVLVGATLSGCWHQHKHAFLLGTMDPHVARTPLPHTSRAGYLILSNDATAVMFY